MKKLGINCTKPPPAAHRHDADRGTVLNFTKYEYAVWLEYRKNYYYDSDYAVIVAVWWENWKRTVRLENWGLQGQFSNKLEVLGNLHREVDWIKLANARIRSGLLWTVQSVNGSLIASRIYTALNQMEWIKSYIYIYIYCLKCFCGDVGNLHHISSRRSVTGVQPLRHGSNMSFCPPLKYMRHRSYGSTHS